MFLYINAKKWSWNLFHHCQTIVVLNIEFNIVCCIQSLKKSNALKVGQKYFWNWLVELCSEKYFYTKRLIYCYFYLKSWKCTNKFEVALIKIFLIKNPIFHLLICFFSKIWTTNKIKQSPLAFSKYLIKFILNMWFFNIIDTNSKNMYILNIERNNISKFNMLRHSLWLLYIFFDKDHKLYTWLCFHP